MASMVISTVYDLGVRRQLWITLSELFLDCDRESYYSIIAKECACSPYTIDELYPSHLKMFVSARRYWLLIKA
ncbi:DUF7079 family protein [Photobacterium nomapromontoriensis]|uniref:DUF7079 family protein n=1 Tax=Photobacterium nomapromontoriensis TaxID=2910237 RepID=UPI003D096ED0